MLISDNLYGKTIVAVFMLICAFFDFKDRRIDIRIFIGMAAAECISCIILHITGKEIDFLCMCIGLSVGVFVLIAAGITRGQIGAGDACYFALSGLGMGGRRNILFFLGSLLLCAVFGLIQYCIRLFRGAGSGNSGIPMLTLACPIGILVVMLL